MEFEDLTPEQKALARDAKTPEDVFALAKELGYELADEELSGISGGAWSEPCDDLGSTK